MNTHTSLFLLLLLLCCGCQEVLYHDLDERTANEVVVALHEAGVQARKIDAKRGGYAVEIPRGTTSLAMHALRAEGLPRPAVQEFDELVDGDSIVPSPQQEHARLQYATAQQIRGSLLAIDGVVDAQVNLVSAPPPRLGGPPPEPPRASVVIRWAGEQSPVTDAAVRRIVAHGAAGLDQGAVEVLLTPTREQPRPAAVELVTVGPLTVPAPQKSATQLVLAALVSGIGVLALMLIAFVRGGQRA